MSPLFLAAIEATEEAILNSLFRATTVTGHHGTALALPLDRVRDVLEQANRLNQQR
jgi:D-aminopeptidase